MKTNLKDLRTGLLIGSTMSIPGVSGGTMAVALGCYGEILSAAANLRERKNRRFLFRILAGGIFGFFSGARFLNYTLGLLPITVTMLFSAAVLTGIGILAKETILSGISINGILFFLLGLFSIFAVEKIPNNTLTTNPIFAIIGGIILSVGLILPGISTSHILTIFGLYETLGNLSLSRLPRLFPVAVGTLIGILLLTKPLAKALDKYPENCNCILIGFALGSLKMLIEPCIGSSQIGYHPLFQIINGAILSAAAVFGISALHRKENKKIVNCHSGS